MQIISRNISYSTLVTSVLLAFFASTRTLNLIVLGAVPSFAGGFMSVLYIVLIALLFFFGCLYQRKSLLNITTTHFYICVLCIVWYFITDSFVGTPSVSVPIFSVMTVAALLLPGVVRINVRIFLMTLLILPAIGVFYMQKIILTSIVEEGIVSMGLCYAILDSIIANFVFVRYYLKKEKLILKIVLLICTAINIYYLFQIAMFGSRGPVLCVLLLVITFFLIKVDDAFAISFRKGRFVIFSIAFLIVGLLFKPFLLILSELFASFDITFNVIDKFLALDDTGDMSNGRQDISAIAWNSIFSSPIFGHGISQFERNTGIVYPHNFIIQMIYDGGIFLTSCVFLPILTNLVRKIRNIRTDEMYCLLYLIFASVPGALFSGDLWESSTLWLLFGFILSKKSIT